jgi:cyclopropane-fatty-acyl-phospholipid synthase
MRGVARMPTAARVLVALLERLEHGRLELVTPDGVRRTFGRGSPRAAAAVLRLGDWGVAADVLSRGDVGFAQAYIDGRWQAPDVAGVLTLLAANRPTLERAFNARGVAKLALRFAHWLNANTRAQARRNVSSHYDLGNDFYRLWLDETMTYSSAWFGGDGAQPLERAQDAKYRRVLDALRLPRGAHILEVGCGWGGFAEVAAREGYRVTGLSLSAAQTAYARERIARAGHGDRVEFRVQDYRDERGRYDGVVSIEMVEAVGERWWPVYFDTLARALPRGGRACLQAITMPDARFEAYRRSSDFIQQQVFPGGMLPAPSRLVERAGLAGLALAQVATFGADYAETLRRWLAAFERREAEVRALGFDERFVRRWRFYLAYCIAGFATGMTDVGHYTFARA